MQSPEGNAEVSAHCAGQDAGHVIEELKRELGEARRREAATSAILKIISSSPTHVQPVFEMIVHSAVLLCGGLFGFLLRYDGELIHLVANVNHSPAGLEAYQRVYPRLPSRETASGRAILDRAVIVIPDMERDAERSPALQEAARIVGVRSTLTAPMLRDGKPIGAIIVGRAEPGPFTDEQIGLLQSFADQAVIAIENTRLFEEVQARSRELAESLDQQTATSEVLGVISSSPGELKPVFEVMLANATRICAANFGTMYLHEAEGFRAVATHNAPPAYLEARTREIHLRAPSDTPLGRMAITKEAVQISDIRTTQSYLERHPFVVAAAEGAGYRTILAVPMLKDDELIGAFTIIRQEVQPFTDKQIELIKSFAAQAVIAIENTRLLNELREVASATNRHRRRSQINKPVDVRSTGGARHAC